MTVEKAIYKLNSLKQYYNDENEDGYVGFDREDNEALDMAIKALEQQPCEDCISREEVIKLLEKEDWADTVEGVLALPPVTPKAEWILCSERLPEDSRNVLITLEPYGIVVPGWFSNKKKIWYRLYQGRWAEVIDAECDVIAWHYFPNPYKEESNGSES